MNRTAAESAVLPAFFDRVEPQGFVVLWLHHGDESAAERTLAAVSRAFCAQSGNFPSSTWPARFWRLLAMTPCISSGKRQWPPSMQRLAEIDDLPRRALLLRLAGELQEHEAAAAMGIAVDAYERLLVLACPRDDNGEPDAAAWRQLADTIRRAVRQLSEFPPHAECLRRIRAAAISGRPIEPGHSHDASRIGRIPEERAAISPSPEIRFIAGNAQRKRKIGIRAVVLALLVALAVGTLYWRLSGRSESVSEPLPEVALDAGVLRVIDSGWVQVETLPPETAMRSRATAAAATPAPIFEPPMPELAFFAWYAAGMPSRQIEHEPAPASVQTWMRSQDSNSELIQDRLAWENLGHREQIRIRQAMAAFSELPSVRQHELRADFAERDELEQRGWLLGPELGSRYVALQPLFGLVPEVQRRPLLDMLHSMDVRQIHQLTVLAQRVPPQERDQLRHDLLAVAPSRRGDWLNQRLQ
ncbi:MAG: hypothetical protein LBV45_10980 [Xanthomonadaceae bacterium]|jgi:hypothetical protein|nr:hypothetical protein [Xanthomonadaceae bacterium]